MPQSTVVLVHGAWADASSWAVVGTEDRVITPATQRRVAERAGASAVS